MMRLAIGIDLGGTSTYGAVVAGDGRQVAAAARPTPAREGAEAEIGRAHV